jgi:hypothetical protein
MEQVAFQRSERENPPIDIGWVLDARLDDLDRRAVLEAVEAFDRLLASHLPGFDWRSATRTRELVQAAREEPVVLLEAGALELALDHWDFAFVVTGSDLVSHYRPSTVAVPSRALGVTVLSTFHLDPRVRSAEASAEERSRLITRRVTCLAMCSLGHLLGLPRSRASDNFMTEVDPTSSTPGGPASRTSSARSCWPSWRAWPTSGWRRSAASSAPATSASSCARPGATAARSSTAWARAAGGSSPSAWAACRPRRSRR